MTRNLFILPADPTWTDSAACRGKPPEWWHPQPGNRDPYAYTTGRIICATCPVQQECLHTAIVNREEHGMWGATTPKQRRHIRRGATIDYPCRLCTGRIRHSAATPPRWYCYDCGYQLRLRQHRQYETRRKGTIRR